MDELLEKLQLIQAEKNKLIPSVLKAGVTIFGVTGTYDGSEPEPPTPTPSIDGDDLDIDGGEITGDTAEIEGTVIDDTLEI